METQEYFKENTHLYAEFFLHTEENRESIMKEMEKIANLEQETKDQIKNERIFVIEGLTKKPN